MVNVNEVGIRKSMNLVPTYCKNSSKYNIFCKNVNTIFLKPQACFACRQPYKKATGHTCLLKEQQQLPENIAQIYG